MSIAHRILVLILLPLVAILGLSGLIVGQRISTLARMDQLTKGGAIIQALDDLVAAVQTERGRTAAFLGANGARGVVELDAQRQAVDDRRRTLALSIDNPTLARFNTDAITAAHVANSNLADLARLRRAVTDQAIGSAEATRRYSEMVESLLVASLAIVHDTDQPGLENNALALDFIQAAKERAGLARATGAAGLASGAMSGEQLYHLVALAAEEDEYAKLFQIYGPDSVREGYATRSKSGEAMEVDRLRRLMLATPAGQPAGVDAGQWFKAATARVELLNDVQSQILAVVLAQVTQARSEASRDLLATSSLVLAAIAGVSTLGFFVMRSITTPIVEVARKMASLADDSVRRAAETKAQMGLDANLTALREMLYSHGKPRQEGNGLYFGEYRVDGSNEIVDEVQRRFGGAATIFLGDVRVATNILKSDGSRAVGTSLARGPAYDAALGNAKMFKGETQIFGKCYVTLYEPIIDGAKVLGILFVGVLEMETAAGDSTTPGARDEVGQMLATLAILEQATKSKDEAEGEALEQRYLATDRARQATAMTQFVAEEQKVVVAALSAALESLANTDLTHSIETRFPSQFQNLETNFAAATKILRDTMNTIRAQAAAISEVTGDISRATEDLSRRTERQAASLEETAAALDEITANVKHTAEGAGHGRDVVAVTKSDAERSGEVMRRAVTAMGGIQQSSEKIGQIIGVIDEIAFQTNLLALNAGVEAARAGDAGRGFAVVAAEVRALAQRSAEAAKEIKALISTSSRQVDEGVRWVGETGSALERILGQVAEINAIISDIATATQEQATGLAEVNTAVNQMDLVTQQNVAMVEQSAAASRTLSQETEELTRLIERFRIDRESGAVPRIEDSAWCADASGSREPARALRRSA